jgi:hypothetical protein
MRAFAILGLMLCSVLPALPACSTMQNAAAKDPMRCERDPSCAKHRSKTRDCTTQCADNPSCMDRCRQVSNDGLGTPP